MDRETAFNMGMNCALKGANTDNCHFSVFAIEEFKCSWERGKREGLRVKRNCPVTDDPETAKEMMKSGCGIGIVDISNMQITEPVICSTCGAVSVNGGTVHCDACYKKALQWKDDLQSGMYINCVYCGYRYGPKDEVPATLVEDKVTRNMADALKSHIERCTEHPLYKLKQVNNKLLEALKFYATQENWRSPSVSFERHYDRKPSLIKTDHGEIAQIVIDEVLL